MWYFCKLLRNLFTGQKQYLLHMLSLVAYAFYLWSQMENATYEQSTEICRSVFSDVKNGVKAPTCVDVKNLH